MKNQTKTIVITGAESTGKSTLSAYLANHFGVPFIPEIAREYVENLKHKYNYADVETIARIQMEQFEKFQKSDYPYIFIDTWLIVTKIWFEVVFKKEPFWLQNEIQKTKIDLFLICDIDIPWISDPVRENGGEKRKVLHNLYVKTISDLKYPYKIVSGKNEQRFINARQFVNEIK